MNELIVKSESGGMELSSSALDTLMKYEETLAALKTDYDELKKETAPRNGAKERY